MTFFFFFSSRRRHTRWPRDWSSDVCSSDLADAHYLSDCRSIRFRLSRPRKIERLREILLQSNLDWKERINPSEPKVLEIIIRQFPKWLENRKTWTSECLSWSQDTLQTIISELQFWDGCKSGPNSVEYVTTNKNNAGWIITM